MHHFSRESLEGSVELPLSPGSDKKHSYKLTASNSIEQSLDQNQGYSVTYGSQDEDENEPIITSPSVTPPMAKKFEKHMSSNASKSTALVNGLKAKNSSLSKHELHRMQSGDIEIEESSSVAARKARLEGTDGAFMAKSSAMRQDQKTMRVGDTLQQKQSLQKATASQVCTEDTQAQNRSFASKQQATSISPMGVMHQEKNVSSTSSSSRFVSKSGSSNMTSSSSNVHQMCETSTSSSSSQCFSANAMSMVREADMQFDMLGLGAMQAGPRDMFMIQDVSDTDDSQSVPQLAANFASIEQKLSEFAEKLKSASREEAADLLKVMQDMLRKAWLAPSLGYDLGTRLCDTMKECGGLDILISNCTNDKDFELQLLSAQVLQYCLSERTSAYLASSPLLPQVARFTLNCINGRPSLAYVRAATGILAHLFKISQQVCAQLIKAGGLACITRVCKMLDIESLRNCAIAFANLALFGGSENHLAMIKHETPEWLLVLAFSMDDHVRYYACLTISALASNKEIEAAVLKSQILHLVEPFITQHSAQEFAMSPITRSCGDQSKHWLERLVPVLDSDRDEARR